MSTLIRFSCSDNSLFDVDLILEFAEKSALKEVSWDNRTTIGSILSFANRQVNR